MSRERRGAERFPIVAEISLQDGNNATSVNLSSIGIYFHTRTPVAPGEQIAVFFPFTDAGGAAARVRCEAQVLRVDRIDEQRFGVAARYEPVAFELENAGCSDCESGAQA